MPAKAISTSGVIRSRSHHFRRRNDLFFALPPAVAGRVDARPVDAAARSEAGERFETCLGA